MKAETPRYTVVLRRSSRAGNATPGIAVEHVTLLSADSHDAIINHPNLGEILADAALAGWQQHHTLHVTVRSRNS
jgi:hypothetical protein